MRTKLFLTFLVVVEAFLLYLTFEGYRPGIPACLVGLVGVGVALRSSIRGDDTRWAMTCLVLMLCSINAIPVLTFQMNR